MSFRLYKEGQGAWARGMLAGIIFLLGLFASVRFYNFLGEQGIFESGFTVPLINWNVGIQAFLALLLLLPFIVAGIWYYNHQRLADFLIETEAELRNKVTWPTRKETTNNSIVVIVTCIVMGAWIVAADFVLLQAQYLFYPLQNLKG